MKPELSYRRPETMTVSELKKEIVKLQSNIHTAIFVENKVVSKALEKEIRYLQNLRGGTLKSKKQRESLELKKWFSKKKKADLIREYKELVRFSRFDRFTEEAQKKQERAAHAAYQKFTANRRNLPVRQLTEEEFYDLRNFFGNITQELIDKFGYDDVMEAWNEVSGDISGRVDIVTAMYDIAEETKDEPMTPADRAILLRDRLGLEV